MGLVGFGQPDDGVIQMAYVVPDVRAAMSAWVEKVKVGPWFLLEHFTGNDPKYRGRDSTADVAIAMSFAGHMNIELIQPNNEAPSVYREWIERRGYGFHHWDARHGSLIRMSSAIGRPATNSYSWPESRPAAVSPTWTRRPICRATWN